MSPVSGQPDLAGLAALRQLAEELPEGAVRPAPGEPGVDQETNPLNPELGTAAAFIARLRDEGVWMNATAPQRVRAVTHLDVSMEEVVRAATILRDVFIST